MKVNMQSTQPGASRAPLSKVELTAQGGPVRFTKSSGRFFTCLLLLNLLLFLVPAPPAFGETPYFQEIRSIPSSRLGVTAPVALTFLRERQALFVVTLSELNHAGPGTAGLLTTLTGRPLDKVSLPLLVQNPLNVAFSSAADGLYILDPARRTLFKIPISSEGQPELDTSLWEAADLSSIPLQNPTGMTFDPGSGTLYVLDGGQQRIFCITPQSPHSLGAATAQKGGRLRTISVRGTGLLSPRGIAFNPQNRSLYVLNPGEKKIYQLTESGLFRDIIDISGFDLVNPQGMTFAPSADQTDDPDIMHLYIADEGLATGNPATGTGGQIVEFSLNAPVLAATTLAAPTVAATLVRTIDTSLWSPPSPDSAGIDYIPSLGNYLVADCEVDEMTIFTGINLYEMTPAGNLIDTFSTTNLSRRGFSNEPTGLAHNDLNGHWFISDDDQHRIFEIDVGPDQTFGTSDDTRTSIDTNTFNSDDPEGVAFDSDHQVLYVADGVNTEVYKLSPGANGVFDGVPPDGDDVMTHFDTSVLGMTDLEGIEYNPFTQTIYLVGEYSSSTVYEVNTDGVAVRMIDVSAAEPTLKAPAGLAYGPGSSGPNSRSLYLAARGQDNDSHPDENDGKVFEFTLPGPVISSFSPTSGGESTPVTIIGSGFSGTTSVQFDGVNATYTVSSDTQIDTSVPTGATTGAITVAAPGGTAISTSIFTVTTAGPTVSLSPTSLSFGDQALNTTSAAQTVALSNTGSAPLAISDISITGTNASDFAQTNGCGSTLAVGANCTISVTFAPTATGARSASLSISDDATGSPQTVPLSGTGTAATVSLSPASLSFGDQALNTTSAAQPVTLSNTGTAPIAISGISITGTNASDFAQTNGCSSTLAAGANCTIGVTFTPTVTGSRSATLSITDDAEGSPRTVSLTGTGTGTPTVSLSTASLSFGDQALNTTSPAQTVTLTNDGNGALTITSLVASGDFAQTNTCGSSVAAGANCQISVTFTPTATGTRTGAITVTDNAGDSPQTVSLTGTGIAPTVSLSPASLSFGDQEVNTTSTPQPVTLTNSGTASLTITSIAASGNFAQTNTCGGSVGVGASCTINVTFTPTATGTRTGTLTITDNAVNSPQTVGLSGNGTAAPAPVVSSVVPSTLLMGTTATLAINGSNFAQGASLSFANGQSSAPVVNSLSVVSTTKITARVTAPANGPKRDRTWDVVVTNPDGSSGALPAGLTLVATGPVVSLSPASLNFGTRQVGTTSDPQTVTLSNTGNTALSISSVSLTGTNASDFAQSGNCGSSVSAGTSCQISVTFSPSAAGSRVATLSIADNAGDSPQTVSLSGAGESSATPTVRLTPSSLTFGSQEVGTTSDPQTVALTNTGTATLTISSIMASGDFAETDNCNGSVAPDASCQISVTFRPTTTGMRTGAVTIADNAGSSPQVVSLSGTGVSAATVVVESVMPNSLPAGATGTLTITGLNFASGASLSFANGQGSAPSVNSVTFVNPGTIQANVTVPSNGPKRNRVWDVVVTNPDGSNGRLLGGFTIMY